MLGTSLQKIALCIGLAATMPAIHAETIVLIRHGEKPSENLGQLTCQGLQRALAIASVLPEKFGKPAAIYAPDPNIIHPDSKTGKLYHYIRPLMTIEPTAIKLEMPVNTKFGFDNIGGMTTELTQKGYRDKTIYVAWEHAMADRLAKSLLRRYQADDSVVPEWPATDFDSIYVIKINDDKASFVHDHENITSLSQTCPSPTATPSTSATH